MNSAAYRALATYVKDLKGPFTTAEAASHCLEMARIVTKFHDRAWGEPTIFDGLSALGWNKPEWHQNLYETLRGNLSLHNFFLYYERRAQEEEQAEKAMTGMGTLFALIINMHHNRMEALPDAILSLIGGRKILSVKAKTTFDKGFDVKLDDGVWIEIKYGYRKPEVNQPDI